MTKDQETRYLLAAARLVAHKDPLLRSLMVRVSLDVAWQGVVSDKLYDDGLRAPADEAMADLGRRTLTELA